MNHMQLLLSKSKRNKLSCEECSSKTDEGHLYCIKLYKAKDGSIKYDGEYTVGCTHEEWDGVSWCDNCYTIADNKVLCASCGHLDWGKPTKNFGFRNYVWIDGSITCYNDLVK